MQRTGLVAGIIAALLMTGCTQDAGAGEKTKKEEENVEMLQLTIDSSQKYQQLESFGASGAWWAQDVGGWEEKEGQTEQSKRDKIAELLFDPQQGIGLSSYRYNLGAGSADTSNSPAITDPWRRGQSFEKAPGVYDWEKDQNARYMLEKAVSYGVEDIYLFSNSPLERLTKNGRAYGTQGTDDLSNLAPENYEAFCDYLFDVTEHFLEQGIPVKYLSPINEPQWDWTGGQEGCHYSPEEVVAFAKAAYAVKQQRPQLQDVELSVPELGEWQNTSLDYYEAMTADKDFMAQYPVWDIHSYWSDKFSKNQMADWLKAQESPIKVKMSEWTEMVNGKDLTMDSAYNLADQIMQDLTILNVSDWQYWIAVSCYDYRDGLIYVDTESHEVQPSKRLWAMGNFSKFIRPGAVRIQSDIEKGLVETVAFENAGKSGDTVLVALNKGFSEERLQVPSGYWLKAAYVTSDTQDLESATEAGEQAVALPKKAVATLVLEKAAEQ